MSKKKERPDRRTQNSISRNEEISINNMTRKQFEAVPYRSHWGEYVTCDCVVIVPMRKIHDSGYRYMDFVAIKDEKPLCRLSGCSDVIHIDGIGGGGYRIPGISFNWSDLVERKAWDIDCLSKSGLLRMWADSHSLICGSSLSSFELWGVKK